MVALHTSVFLLLILALDIGSIVYKVWNSVYGETTKTLTASNERLNDRITESHFAVLHPTFDLLAVGRPHDGQRCLSIPIGCRVDTIVEFIS
jgi:hypothetical protein